MNNIKVSFDSILNNMKVNFRFIQVSFASEFRTCNSFERGIIEFALIRGWPLTD